MADTRIIDLKTTATSFATDDYLGIDGATNGSRRILGTNIAEKAKFAEPADVYILDGTNDYLQVSDSDNLDFGTNDFSISMLVKLSDYTPSSTKLLLEKHASNLGWKLFLTTSGAINFQIGNGSDFTTYSYTTSALGLTDNKWYHLVFTIDRDGLLSVYVNGLLSQSVSISGASSQTISSSGALSIFGNGSSYTGGNINALRFFNLLLSQSNITNLYNNGQPHLVKLPYELNGANGNLLSNSDMELDDSSWTSVNSPVTNERSSTYAYSGSYSRHGAFNNVASIIRNSVLLSPTTQGGKLFRIRAKVYLVSGLVKVTAQEAGGAFLLLGSQTITTIGSWVDVDFTFTSSKSYITWLGFGYTSSGECYVDNFTCTQLGCVAEYLPENAGAMGWLDSSTNMLHATTSGNPICASKLRDYKSNISTTAVQMVSSQKAGTNLKYLIAKNNYAGSNTVSLGTTSSANELVNDSSLASGETKVIEINSFVATDRSLYVKAGSSNVDVILVYEVIR